MSVSGGPDIVENGLVLYLDAGNTRSYLGSGTIWTDVSGNNNSGSLTNGPTFSNENGGSIVFDGVDDYVAVGNPSSLNISSQITLSAWVNLPLYSGSFVDIIAKGLSFGGSDASYYLGIINDGRFSFEIVGAGRVRRSILLSAAITSTFNDRWIHFMGTYNGTLQNLYVNGDLRGTNTYSALDIDITTGNVNVGGTPSARRITGKIAQVSIYNRVLTPQEILQNYNATRSRFGV
jgi:hypothetical protein